MVVKVQSMVVGSIPTSLSQEIKHHINWASLHPPSPLVSSFPALI